MSEVGIPEGISPSEFAKLKSQLQFYFSDANLRRDKFMRQTISAQRRGYVDISVIAEFNKVKSITKEASIVVAALKQCDDLKVSENELRVKRVSKLPPIGLTGEVDRRMVYIEGFGKDEDHDTIREAFEAYGRVEIVSLPRFPETRELKGFGFVEMSTREAAQDAVAGFDKGSSGKKWRVMHKEDWARLKREFLQLKRNAAAQKHIKANDDEEGPEEKNKKSHVFFDGDGGSGDEANDSVPAATAPVSTPIVDTSNEQPAKKKNIRLPKGPEFSPGVLVQLDGVPSNALKSDIKSIFTPHASVAFIDFNQGDSIATIRFNNAEDAKHACHQVQKTGANFKGAVGKATLLTGESENEYWEKIKKDSEDAIKRRLQAADSGAPTETKEKKKRRRNRLKNQRNNAKTGGASEDPKDGTPKNKRKAPRGESTTPQSAQPPSKRRRSREG